MQQNPTTPPPRSPSALRLSAQIMRVHPQQSDGMREALGQLTRTLDVDETIRTMETLSYVHRTGLETRDKALLVIATAGMATLANLLADHLDSLAAALEAKEAGNG